MNRSISYEQVKSTLLRYLEFTEPELQFGDGEAEYTLTVMPDECRLERLDARSHKMEKLSVSEMFDSDRELFGICLKRDWDKLQLIRCVPSLDDPDAIISRYQAERRKFPDRETWVAEVTGYLQNYLEAHYPIKQIHYGVHEYACWAVEDFYLMVTPVAGLRGIVVETAGTDYEASHGIFEDSDIIYEGFDKVDALTRLKDMLGDHV